ncbi:MAG: tRNA (adenosine(37)-N6)-threonylcarbamoyltransferase complex dimerization subunit type 1 TsaB [Clostridia bacterium]
MKILACDTSSSVCSVGVFDDDKLIAENEIDNGKTHSENFMPLVKKSLEDANLKLSDIDCFSVVVGPGSFTGIRIGVASLKAMAEVGNSKVVSVYSLEVLAANEYKKGRNICSMIDARNNQVYCGIFNEELDKLDEFMADDISACLENIKKYDNIVFVGNGSILHLDLIKEFFKDKNIEFSVNNKQNARSLGIISCKKARKGEYGTADTVVPVYLRKSQAERMKNDNKL